MGQRYLVTGCAGFIGACVTAMLLERGQKVIGIDNLNESYNPRLKAWRLERLQEHANFQFASLDVGRRDALNQLDDASETGRPFDAVFHLAARACVRESVRNPWAYYLTNVIGTLNLLEYCREQGIPKFILASTSSLYSDPTTLPWHEGVPSDRPLSPYAASKKAAETLAYSFHHLHGVSVTVFRYFTVYGPAGRPDMAVYRFIRAVMQSEPIVVYGDGHQERDFTFVDDVARGTIAGLNVPGYEIINLGNGRPISVHGLIAEIEAQLETSAIVYRAASHPADAQKTWADIRKARDLLGWTPTVPLEEGLARTIGWFRDNPELIAQLDHPAVAADAMATSRVSS